MSRISYEMAISQQLHTRLIANTLLDPAHVPVTSTPSSGFTNNSTIPNILFA